MKRLIIKILLPVVLVFTILAGMLKAQKNVSAAGLILESSSEAPDLTTLIIIIVAGVIAVVFIAMGIIIHRILRKY